MAVAFAIKTFLYGKQAIYYNVNVYTMLVFSLYKLSPIVVLVETLTKAADVK